MKKHIATEDLYQLFLNCNQKISTDTRKFEKGAIFFALKGSNFNANEFAEKAITEGCAYAIVDDETACTKTTIFLVNNVLETLQQLAKYHRKQLTITIIGITGSNGKTTNKELIHAVLSKKYNTYTTKGNLNNHIGVPLTLLSITPIHQMAIVEMGANHQGEIAFLSDLTNPDYGIITNIGRAHLEGFGGEEGIKKGKSELYKNIKQNNGKIFINGDDQTLSDLAQNLPAIIYGLKPEYDVYGELFINSEFVEFKWNTKSKNLNECEIIKTHMFGQYNFINLLCAVCVGNYFNVSTQDINNALMEFLPEMNRSQVKKTERNTLILDAYNANPSSMSLAIDNFKKQSFNNKIFILGDMLELGEFSDAEHETILKQVNELTHVSVFLVGSEFYKFKNQYSNFLFFDEVKFLNEYFKSNTITDGVILIKGSRGLKLEQTVDFL